MPPAHGLNMPRGKPCNPRRRDNPLMSKEGFIKNSDNEEIIREIVYYFDSHPVCKRSKFRLRRLDGMSIAHGPKSFKTMYFCPSVNNCWVFGISRYAPLTVGWYADIGSIDIDIRGTKTRESHFDQPMNKYLSGENYKKVPATYYGDIPSRIDTGYGFKPSYLSVLFSPFVIILADLQLFALTLCSTLFFFVFYSLLFKTSYINNKAIKVISLLVGDGMLIIYSVFYLNNVLLLAWFTGVSGLYIALFITLGIILGRQLSPRPRF